MSLALPLFLYVLFYGSYILKMVLQKRRGIEANQLGRGEKPSATRIIEIILLIGTTALAILQAAALVIRPPSPLPQGYGFGIGLLGCVFFIAAMGNMQESWRAGVDLGTKGALVTGGIYRFSRNPAFLGFDLFYWGFALCLPFLPLIIASILLPLMFHLQILEEEKALAHIFGKDYLDYKKRTRRYF